jgi:Protein of unknown function (DUF992)
MPTRRMSLAATAGAICVLALATTTGARANVEAGALSCRGGAAAGMVVTSLHHLTCVFRPAGGGPSQHYEATIRKIGLDLGITRSEVLGWLVFAPSGVVGPGGLAGGYGGVQAAASIGVGVGANGLVGGLNNSFALQPVSVAAQTGVNVAGGLAGLRLNYIGEPRHTRRHRH